MTAPSSPTASPAQDPGLPDEVIKRDPITHKIPYSDQTEFSVDDVPVLEGYFAAWVAKDPTALANWKTRNVGTTTTTTPTTGGGGTTQPTATIPETPVSIVGSLTRRNAIPSMISSNVSQPTQNSLLFQSNNNSTGNAQYGISWFPNKIVDLTWVIPTSGSGAFNLTPVAGFQTENSTVQNGGISITQNNVTGFLVFRYGTDYYATPNPVPNGPNTLVCLYGRIGSPGILPYYSVDSGATWQSDFKKDSTTALMPIVLTQQLSLSFFSQLGYSLAQNITVGLDATIFG
jgi:hypothetical protein